MLDAFETRLADLLADALVGTGNLGPVGRVDAVDDPSAGEVGIALEITDLAPQPHVGDDKRAELREAGQIRLRPTLHLEGHVRLALTSRPPPGPASDEARERLITMLDTVLLALHPQEVRTGRAFATEADQGFELDQFRLTGTLQQDVPDALRVELSFGFAGRFWPVEELPEGDQITAIPTRLTVMPVRVPDRIVTRAASADLSVPVGIDLKLVGDAVEAVAARLEGAAHPGALIGDGTPAPDGYTGFAIGPGGQATLTYRPPADLATAAQVRVELRLARPDRPSIGLSRFEIEVLPA